MNRTQLAVYIAGDHTSDQYKILILLFNELTEKQLTKAQSIALKVKGVK
jgi:hypothetical protein